MDHWAGSKACKRQKHQINVGETLTVANELPSSFRSHVLLVPYTRQKGEHLVRSLRNDMNRALLENVRVKIGYADNKLDTKLSIIKGPVKKPYHH